MQTFKNLISNLTKKQLVLYSMLVLLILAWVGYDFYSDYQRKEFEKEYYVWHKIDLSKPYDEVIQFERKKETSNRCFRLGVDREGLSQKGEAFENHVTRDNESGEFTTRVKGKPHFFIQLYKEGNLIDEKDVYILSSMGGGGDNIENIKYHLEYLPGVSDKIMGACYHIEPNTRYAIRIVNKAILPEFENLDTFLGFIPNDRKI